MFAEVVEVCLDVEVVAVDDEIGETVVEVVVAAAAAGLVVIVVHDMQVEGEPAVVEEVVDIDC